jgi:hypothetical protein
MINVELATVSGVSGAGGVHVEVTFVWRVDILLGDGVGELVELDTIMGIDVEMVIEFADDSDGPSGERHCREPSTLWHSYSWARNKNWSKGAV